MARVTLRMPEARETTVDVARGQSILDAALRAGIELPNSCCQGWCLTCAAKLDSGEVDHPDAVRYYPKDAEVGFILPCTAEPRTDCVIVTHRKEEMKKWRRQNGLPAPGG